MYRRHRPLSGAVPHGSNASAAQHRNSPRVLLTACLALTLAPPRWLVADRLARRIAAGSALALGVGLVLSSRATVDSRVGLEGGIFAYLYLVPIAVIFLGSALTAAVALSFESGVRAAVWTALLASPAIFAVALLEAARWYQLESSLILAGDRIPLAAVGESIRNFTWGLILLPIWWLPFGVIGAAIGGATWWRQGDPETAPLTLKNPHRSGGSDI